MEEQHKEIKNGLPLKLRMIFEGWFNYILDKFSDIKYKDIFEERYRICQQCESRDGRICSVCHCFLKAKTKAEGENCPMGKWKSIN